MQLIITDASLAKSKTTQLTLQTLFSLTLLASLIFVMVVGCLYHWVFLKGVREGWPVVGVLLQLVVKNEFAQRVRYMREN